MTQFCSMFYFIIQPHTHSKHIFSIYRMFVCVLLFFCFVSFQHSFLLSLDFRSLSIFSLSFFFFFFRFLVHSIYLLQLQFAVVVVRWLHTLLSLTTLTVMRAVCFDTNDAYMELKLVTKLQRKQQHCCTFTISMLHLKIIYHMLSLCVCLAYVLTCRQHSHSLADAY